MRKSKIFTNGELEAIEQRKKGFKSDPNGTFYGRVKPKIEELLNKWIPNKKELKELLK